MFFKYINKSKYISITNCQPCRQCTQYWSLLHHLRLYILRALRQPRQGGGKEGYAISRPGLMWPELLGSMWTEAVRWCVKKGPWLLGLRRAPTKKKYINDVTLFGIPISSGCPGVHCPQNSVGRETCWNFALPYFQIYIGIGIKLCGIPCTEIRVSLLL